MAKRFLDTNLFRKRWIRELDTDMKLFWIYLLTDCDHAGIWDVDVERASFQLKLDLNQDKILKTFDRKINNFKVDKWFIPKFVQYQYGELNPNNKAPKPALVKLDLLLSSNKDMPFPARFSRPLLAVSPNSCK